MAKEKKLDKRLLFIVGLIILIIIATVSSFILKSSQYNQALSLFESGNYEEAERLFNKLHNYKDVHQYAVKCHYEIAKILYEDAEYEEAKQEFSLAEGYSDTASYIAKCEHQLAILEKYKEYDVHSSIAQEAFVFGESSLTNQELDDLGLHTPEEVEARLSSLYSSTWYNEETGEPLEITDTTIDNKSYHIVAAVSLYDDEETDLVYYYTSDPNQYYYLSAYTYLNTPVYVLGVYISELGDSSYFGSYLNITPEELEEILIATREPKYSDDTVVSKTLSLFQERIRSFYGPDPSILYHNATVQQSSVEYDPYTESYLCTLNVTYSTNIFDIWGTSNTSYVVNAVYTDTGSSLILSSFNIY